MAFNARAGGQGQCRVGSESPQLAGQGRRGRRRADARLRHSVRGGVARRGPRTGDHRLGGDRARRRRDDPGGALRDGPGQPYRPPHAGRRGARLRLEQGEGGVRQSRGEPAPQPGVGRHVDRRQPFDPGLAGLSAQGRRDRARDADRGGGRPMGCPAGRMPGREQRHHPWAERPHGPLRRGGASRRRDRPAQDRSAESAGGLETDRHAPQAARRRRQDQRPDGLRHRRAGARNVMRGACPMPGVRRQIEERRRGRDRRPAGRAPGRQIRRRRGGGGRYLVAGQESARRLAGRLGRRPAWDRLERVDCGLS